MNKKKTNKKEETHTRMPEYAMLAISRGRRAVCVFAFDVSSHHDIFYAGLYFKIYMSRCLYER